MVSSAKKNIILVGSAYPLRGGGISTFNELLATKLQDAGHQVKILTNKSHSKARIENIDSKLIKKHSS